MQFAELGIRKGGSTFDDLYEMLNGREREFITMPLSTLSLRENGALTVGGEDFFMTKTVARNLAQLLKIPPLYMLNTPDQNAAQNYNFFLPSASGNIKLVFQENKGAEGRTRTDVVGIMKEKTNPVPLEIVVEELERDSHGLAMSSWSVDEEGLVARFISDKYSIEPHVGDIVRAGVDFMDYENTDAGIDVRAILERLVCSNGATAPELAYGRFLKKSDWKSPAAIMTAAMGYFSDAITSITNVSANLPSLVEREFELPEERPEKFIRKVNHVLRIPQRFDESVVDALIPEEPSFFGLYNAVTRLGRDSNTRDVRFLFERAGYRVISLIDEVQEAYNLAIEAGIEND